MFNKAINSTMQDFRKQKPKQQTFPFTSSSQQKEEEKQNSLFQKYQQKLAQKKSHRRLLERAQKIAMKQKIKEIISDNVQYFRNILEANQRHRPNQHSLKLPSKMVPSLYKTEYPKRKQYESQNVSVDMKKSFFDRSKNCSQSKLPLSTTYQTEFKKIQEIQTQKYQRSKDVSLKLQKRQLIAPSFLDTQNNLQFKNWGTGAAMPSMKPSPKSATIDIPFKATSMYRSEFHNISMPKTKIITHQESYPQNIDMWMNNSSYCNDFNRKKMQVPQKCYKPIQNPSATYLPFKSTTQYKQSFIESNKMQENQKKSKKSQIKKLSDHDVAKLVLQL